MKDPVLRSVILHTGGFSPISLDFQRPTSEKGYEIHVVRPCYETRVGLVETNKREKSTEGVIGCTQERVGISFDCPVRIDTETSASGGYESRFYRRTSLIAGGVLAA